MGMDKVKDLPDRKLIRMPSYDYSVSGFYFVTICTCNRFPYFGVIDSGQMTLNNCGDIAVKHWLSISDHFQDVRLYEYAVMPNHIHGIIIINNEERIYAFPTKKEEKCNRTQMLLSKIIQQYKSSVTRDIYVQYNRGAFKWQKSYYDRIIRNENELNCIREYIINNPLKWGFDHENMNGNPDDEEQKFWEMFS